MVNVGWLPCLSFLLPNARSNHADIRAGGFVVVRACFRDLGWQKCTRIYNRIIFLSSIAQLTLEIHDFALQFVLLNIAQHNFFRNLLKFSVRRHVHILGDLAEDGESTRHPDLADSNDSDLCGFQSRETCSPAKTTKENFVRDIMMSLNRINLFYEHYEIEPEKLAERSLRNILTRKYEWAQ